MLEIRNISISFKDFALKELTFNVQPGDYLTLLGISGAGKTVILEVLAGLLKPDSGEVLWNGKNITALKIQERPVGLVYQDLSLFPHLTVYENIAFALKCRKWKKEKIDGRVDQLSKMTGVNHLQKRYPGTLSGGEAQRVAIARTLSSDPEILLLDEPLSSLDITLRAGLVNLLKEINLSGKTIIHVTHDYDEVAALSNKVAVIEDGRLIQSGLTSEVFRHPANAFVARFSKSKNLLPCSVSSIKDGLMLAKVSDRCQIYFSGATSSKAGFVVIPAEDIILSEKRVETSAINQLEGTIKETWLTATGAKLLVDVGAEFVVAVTNVSFENLQLHPGRKIWLNFKASAVRFFGE